jgi:hypothetical protein
MDLETGSTFTGNSQSELPLQALSIKATAEFDAVPASEIRQVRCVRIPSMRSLQQMSVPFLN